ncbi:MAG: dephospho-CoA kinase [Alteromonadaceae bacterium]|nr:dephospho-CoA kinase [Alteromonadaceae bacterium]
MNQLLYPLSPSPLPPGERGYTVKSVLEPRLLTLPPGERGYTTLAANIPSPLAGEGQGEGRKSTYDLPYVILISPLLLETDQHELVEKVIVVDVPESVQLARTMARDDNSREQVERIMAAQMARNERCARADAVINNNNPLADVERQVRECHDRFVHEFSSGPEKEPGNT